MSNEYGNTFEMQSTRRRSSTVSILLLGNPSLQTQSSVSSTSGYGSPIRTIAGRSSTQSVIVVRPPPSFLSPANVRRQIAKSGSEKSLKSNLSGKSSKSGRPRKSAKIPKHLTSSFLRRKRAEYAGRTQIF